MRTVVLADGVIAQPTVMEGSGSTAKAPGIILTADATHGIVVNCRDNATLQLDVISMQEGILPGRTLAGCGIQGRRTVYRADAGLNYVSDQAP